MAKLKFVLNRDGVRDILRGDGIISCMESYASNGINAVADLKDYKIDSHVGGTRANVGIFAKTEKGERDNLDNNILLKALGSSKG